MTTLQSRKKESYKIFDQIAGTYDLLNHILSFGIDIYWRSKMRKLLPERKGLKVLDLACGTGDVSLVMGADDKVESLEGIDLSQGMIDYGRIKVNKKNLQDKVQLNIGDGVTIPRDDQSVDVITLSFGIRNFDDPQKSLENMTRVLKTDGRVIIMEFSIPKSRFFRGVYFFYFRHLLPFVGNLISKHKDAYTYLNQTVEDFPYGNEFAQMMTKAGLSNVQYKTLTFGIATLYWGDKNE
jgi:demethylmenaquinone methyltransferase/2-methoxy-6-polyprenyl-1,4-benzoquinol methylase